MPEMIFNLSLFPLIITIGAYMIGLWLKTKIKHPLCNPFFIGVILTGTFLVLSKMPMSTYLAGTDKMGWLITPATVALALPLYEQLKKLKGQLTAILAGVIAGAVSSLVMVGGACLLFALPREITVSLLPKSITTAMAMVLAEQSGGISSIAAGGVAITGLVGCVFGPILCKLFRFKDPIAQGVAYGTASHVIGTSRVMEINPLSGAVSTLSLVVAGVLTAILMPILCVFI